MDNWDDSLIVHVNLKVNNFEMLHEGVLGVISVDEAAFMFLRRFLGGADGVEILVGLSLEYIRIILLEDNYVVW